MWQLLFIPDIIKTVGNTQLSRRPGRIPDLKAWTALWTLTVVQWKRVCSDRRFFHIQTHRQLCTLQRFRSGDVGGICERLCERKGRGRGRRRRTAHGMTAPLTDRVEASLRFSKGACLSFVETETAGYRSQMQSLTTKGELIAWPPLEEKKKKKQQREEEKKEQEIERDAVW